MNGMLDHQNVSLKKVVGEIHQQRQRQRKQKAFQFRNAFFVFKNMYLQQIQIG